MLFQDITILDRNMKPQPHMNVQITDDRISYVGKDSVTDPDGVVFNGKNKLLMPGFYNTHCHIPMTLTRGMGEGLRLSEWLNLKMFPFEAKMTGEDCYYGALLGAMELISSGCVSISDMYFNILDIANAIRQSGMKANISHGLSMSDPDGNPESLQGWKNTLILMEESKKGDGRIKADMGLHAEYTSVDKLVRSVAEFAKENHMIVHTHISETQKEHNECKQRHNGLTPAQYLESCGIFNNPVMGAHCVWLEDQDREIMYRNGATISHCISSNLKLGSGIASISEYVAKGINTVIATDGASSNNNLNMMEEMHLASLAAKGAFQDPTLLIPEEILKMATINGAKAQGRNDCGVIEADMKADFIVMDLDKPHLVPVHSLTSNLIHSAQSSDIYMTVIDGKIVYKDGEFLTIDRERVQYEAAKRVDRIYKEL